METAKKSLDEINRNAYKLRKMLTPVAGIVEYKTCGLEGFVPTATQLANGLCEIGAYVNKLTGSGSSIMDFHVKYSVDGRPVAKRQNGDGRIRTGVYRDESHGGYHFLRQ